MGETCSPWTPQSGESMQLTLAGGTLGLVHEVDFRGRGPGDRRQQDQRLYLSGVNLSTVRTASSDRCVSQRPEPRERDRAQRTCELQYSFAQSVLLKPRRGQPHSTLVLQQLNRPDPFIGHRVPRLSRKDRLGSFAPLPPSNGPHDARRPERK